MNMLQTGLEWLADRVSETMSSEITYQRGTRSLTINAAGGESIFEIAQESGVVEEVRTQDFIIRVVDLLDLFPPQPGDKILGWQADHTFEVLAVAGRQPWSYCDSFGLMMRVHSKLV